MTPEVMQREYRDLRDDLTTLFSSLHELAVEINDPETRAVTGSLIANIHAPFLFVVVGEVKAGKSSFINTLLGDTVCAVAPDPCTDVIEKIIYAEDPYVASREEFMRERGLAKDILKEIAVVDTPGTNSIVERHQEITEGFIPESDLVIFVFPALNPYAKSAWDLLGFVRDEWRKKVIFVLQQADRASDDELAVNVAKVREYALTRGMDDPLIFPTSARTGMGMEDVWAHIRATVTGGRHFRLKMESLASTAGKGLDMLDTVLAAQVEQLATDRQDEQRIMEALERGQEAALRDAETLRTRILAAYGDVSEDACLEFESGLSLPGLFKNTLLGVFGRKNSFKKWLKELHGRFNERFSGRVATLSRTADDYLGASIRRTVEGLLADLKRTRGSGDEDSGVTSIASRRVEGIDRAAETLFALLREDTVARSIQPQGLRKIGDHAVMGGVITTVGAIITASAHTVVFDVTGGLFATVGALLAINTIAFKRRSIIREFRKGFAEGGTRLDAELSETLNSQVERVFKDLRHAFDPFSKRIRENEAAVEGFSARSLELRARLEGMAQRIKDAPDPAGES